MYYYLINHKEPQPQLSAKQFLGHFSQYANSNHEWDVETTPCFRVIDQPFVFNSGIANRQRLQGCFAWYKQLT
jgi:hypothetical protein